MLICQEMKGKNKQKMATKPLELGGNEATSHCEVGVQDSMCIVAPQQGEPQTMPESVSSVLDKLVNAVNGVAGKIGSIETRLSSLGGEVRHPNATLEPVISVESDEPLFGTQLGVGTKPKVRKKSWFQVMLKLLTQMVKKLAKSPQKL